MTEIIAQPTKRKERIATSAHTVARLLAMGLAGIPQKAISIDLGIAQPTVSKLMRRHGMHRYHKTRYPTLYET